MRQRIYRRACYLLIAGALLCFAIFFGLQTATTDTETDEVAVTRTRETLKSSETSPVRSGVWDDAPDAFYATIIENNLFRLHDQHRQATHSRGAPSLRSLHSRVRTPRRAASATISARDDTLF